MNSERRATLTSVKQSLFHRPAIVGGGAAALIALLAANGFGVMRGTDAPWLLGVILVADMAVIGAGILIAAREVLVAERRTEATQARLAAIVDSAMDAVITVDEEQKR